MIKFGEGAKSLLASSYIIDNLRLHIDGRVWGSPYLWNLFVESFCNGLQILISHGSSI